MAIKSVLVRLRGENGDLNRALLGSAAASKTLGRNLDDADKSGRRLSDTLEVSNDRTTMLVQSALALGPALVPLGAQAVPVIMGLGTQLGFAAGAAGVTALAFSGIGDTLKAVNEYQIEPTTANLEKMQEELDKLGPAGRDFVGYLQELRPQLQVLQDIAQAGMLPGAEQGIRSLMTMLPQVERVVGTIASTLGDLMGDAGADLAGPEWRAFFSYIESDAQPILSDMSRTAGNFIHGFAEMIAAFGPLTREFSDGFLGMSRDFEKWASGLSSSEGFHSFVAYIEDTGPQVVDTLGALAGAVISIVEAAAPVGAVALPIIEALADAISAIAATPIGTVLIGVAAGVSAVSRALALYQAANGSALLGSLMGGGARGGTGAGTSAAAAGGIGGMIGTSSIRSAIPAMREYNAAVGELRASEAAASSAHARYLGALRASSVREELIPGIAATETMAKRTNELRQANMTAAGAAGRVAAAEKAKKAALRESAVGAGKAAGLVGGLAFATSGYADKAGLANTASLALMGTIVGPWGTAAGAGVGFAMDLASANGDVEESFNRIAEAAQKVAGSSGLDALNQQYATASDSLDELKAKTDAYDSEGNNLIWQIANPGATMTGFKNSIEGLFGRSDVEEAQSAQAKAAEALDAATTRQAEAAAAAATTTDRYRGAVGDAGIAAGITASKVRGLVSAMEEQRAQALGSFDAETGYAQALMAARKQAEKSAAGINLRTAKTREEREAIIANRQALSGLAGAWNNQSEAVRNNEARYKSARKQFIQTAIDMGATGKAARDLANDVLDVPNKVLIQTLMSGDKEARAKIRGIINELDQIDRNVRTDYWVVQHNSIVKPKVLPGNPDGAGADGTVVPKSGLPYADRYLYAVADGERIISNRHGQSDEYAAVLQAINDRKSRDVIRGMLADGGVAGAWHRQPQPAVARYQMAPTAGATQSLVGLRIEGRLETNDRGESYLRGVVREEIDADQRFQRVKSGR